MKPTKKKSETPIKKEFDISRLIPISIERARIYEKKNSIYKTVMNKTTKLGKSRTLVRIKISSDIIKDLNFKTADIFTIYCDPDNIKKIYLIKTDNGYKLSYFDDFFQLIFPWKMPNHPLEICPIKKLDYEIVKTKSGNLLSMVL